MTAPDVSPKPAGLDRRHDLLVAGADAWIMLAAAAHAFAGAPNGSSAQLLSLSGSKFTDGDCTLSLRVAGADPGEARRIADTLAQHPDVRLARIEHIVWKART